MIQFSETNQGCKKLVAQGELLEIGCLDGDDVPGILDYPLDLHVWCSDTGGLLPVEEVGIDDYVHDAGFIFEAQKDKALGSPRSLTCGHATSHSNHGTVWLSLRLSAVENTVFAQTWAMSPPRLIPGRS